MAQQHFQHGRSRQRCFLLSTMGQMPVVALVLLTTWLPLAISAHAAAIEGYLSSYSATLGGSVDIHVSTSLPTYKIKIRRYGYSAATPSATFKHILGNFYGVPAQEPWKHGAGWPVSYTFRLPDTDDWQPGLYRVYIRGRGAEHTMWLPVRDSTPGATSKILFLDNLPTVQAYNTWGGKSLYPQKIAGQPNIPRDDVVSLQRPIPKVDVRVKRFAQWASFKGIPMEYASLMDLDRDSSLLNDYNLVVIAGHSEYWSKNMRDNFDRFVQDGGNAVILSGNTMWWQVRIEGDQMVGYKGNFRNDPLYGVNDDLVTTRFSDERVVDDPENRSIGVSFRNGGFVNARYFPTYEHLGQYTVFNTDHWLFDGTGLEDGDQLGITDYVFKEVDGAEFTWVDGKPVVTGTDGTPLNFQILGYHPSRRTPRWFRRSPGGATTMGIFDVPGGGTVFNAASMSWVNGLWDLKLMGIPDPEVSRITYNAITRLSGMSVVPTPSAVWMGIALIACLGVFTAVRKQISARRG